MNGPNALTWGLLAFNGAGAKRAAPNCPRILVNCRALTLPREFPGGQLQMCEALQGSDDLVQSVQGVMPCNVGDLEDLDEGPFE